MPSFTVKNIPEPLFARLKASAELHHRSINGEILVCLERTLGLALEPREILARVDELRRGFRGEPLTFDDIQAAKNLGRK